MLIQDFVTARRAMWREALPSTVASSGNFDISAIQFATLFLLAGEEELMIKQVADLLERSVSATSRLLDQLVTRGLVSRNEDERDRRIKRIALSQDGRAFVRGIERKRAESQMAIMVYLSPEEREVVTQAIHLLAVAARRYEDEQTKPTLSSTTSTQK